jgi:hypothetical protein
VILYIDSVARNYDWDIRFMNKERYEIAEWYIDAVHRLWLGSWCGDVAREIPRMRTASSKRCEAELPI